MSIDGHLGLVSQGPSASINSSVFTLSPMNSVLKKVPVAQALANFDQTNL